jgi:hypothetical protein
MESRVRGNVQARFGEGDTPYPQGSTVPTLHFYEHHWLPLYEALGYGWHESA